MSKVINRSTYAAAKNAKTGQCQLVPRKRRLPAGTPHTLSNKKAGAKLERNLKRLPLPARLALHLKENSVTNTTAVAAAAAAADRALQVKAENGLQLPGNELHVT